MAGGGSSGSGGTRRIMVFIDGGYLRKNLKNLLGHEIINYDRLVNELRIFTSYGNLFPELIRAYYYDAKLKAEDVDVLRVNNGDLDSVDLENLSPKYDRLRSQLLEQESFLRQLKNYDYFEVRLGRLKIGGTGSFKQKGVDVLISIDMISKAYENHYDIAVLLSGDEDLLDIVNAVKDTGKRVFGVYFENHISNELKDSFDKRKILDLEFVKTIMPASKRREQFNE